MSRARKWQSKAENRAGRFFSFWILTGPCNVAHEVYLLTEYRGLASTTRSHEPDIFILGHQK